ncbi:tetratricopeptide repeat protein [Rhodoplanes azumiensis]|uniref:protein O-GlcNAc transferase n=1 Tax=Rhodoplanes azumiensis TaxID=1897628 RepID=A0ABW5ADF4_9BRAD
MARSVDDTFRRAVEALQAGRASEAERAFRKVLEAAPRHPGALNLYTVLLMRLGRWAEAEPYARRAARETAGSDVTLYNFGLILKQVGKPAEALEPLGKALALNPRVPDTLITRAGVLRDLGRHDEALADADAALALDPTNIDPLIIRASVLGALRRFDEALAAYERAAAQTPERPEPWVGCGKTLVSLKRPEAALAAFDRALAVRPGLPEALQGRGATLATLGRFAEALAAYDQALALDPDRVEAWIGIGDVFLTQQFQERAIIAYDGALMRDPASARALLHRAKALYALGRLGEAATTCDRALALSESGEAWVLRGGILSANKEHAEAVRAYEKALGFDPELKFVLGARLHNKLQICDWTDFDEDVAALIAAVRDGRPAAQPLNLLALSASAADQRRCAEMFADDGAGAVRPMPAPTRPLRERIRIAYLSADLRDHPAAYLTAGLFEHHDRSRFDIFAIVWGERSGSAMARRIDAAVNQVLDVSEKTDAEVADLIRQLEVDILVDLMGFTQNCRFPVLARRPAPIQVNYLGFPGTMGTDLIDYILADEIVVPDEQRGHYAESIVRLPQSFQVNDDRRPGVDRPPARAALGLPDEGFVFCCFNNSYKIGPGVFDIWMRLLACVEGSVLWLLGEHPGVESNLRREAGRRGVDPARLVFAGRVPYADYLARYPAADLFLDTIPFNAGTTASDSLWAGLPVLTCSGEAFASRMAASLLQAVGLPELVTSSLADYEAAASALARDPARLAALRTRLAENRTTAPLFDTARFTRGVETAFAEMWRRWQAGGRPADFSVGDNSAS